MDPFSSFLKKAVYLGVGLASYAGEKASDRLAELAQDAQEQAKEWVRRGEATTERFTEFSQDLQKKANELVQRGELTAEEARHFVEEMLENAQAAINTPKGASPSSGDEPPQPKTIDITVVEEEESTD